MKIKILLLAMIMVISLPIAFGEVTTFTSLKFPGVSEWTNYDVTYSQVNQEPDPAQPGRYVDVRFRVQNIGSNIAEGAKFRIVESYPFTIYDPDKTEVKIGDIEARQIGQDAYILYWRLKVDENALEGDNLLRLQYSLNDGADWVTVGPYTLRVRAVNPVLSITDIESTPETVSPGEQISLNMDVKNLANAAIKDVTIKLGIFQRVTLATGVSDFELPFSPVGSTNEKFVKSIDAGETEEFEFDLVVDPDAESKVYKLPITLEYSDNLATNYSKELIVAIVVNEEADIAITLDDSEVHVGGDTGGVDVKFVNKGNSDLKFFFVELEETSEFKVLSAKEVYLGQIDSDDYQTANFDIKVDSGHSGDLELPIKYEYRDAMNNKVSLNKKVIVPMYSEQSAEDLGLKQKSNYTGVLIIVGIIVVGLVIFFIYRRNKNKKSQSK